MKKFHNIAIVDTVKISETAKDQLQEFSESPLVFPHNDAGSEQEVIQRVGDADAVLGSWQTIINAKILLRCSNVHYIGICGTSMANIDIAAVKKRNVTLRNVEHYGDEGPAEYIFTQLLILARGFGKHRWKAEPTELNEKTLGIVGLGTIGQELAKRALGFNMRVVYHSPTRKSTWEERGVTPTSLKELLKISDIISLHVPKNFVVLGALEFALIRPGTILVDTCLGNVLDFPEFMKWIGKKENFTIFDSNKKFLFDASGIPDNVIGVHDGIAGITQEARQRLSQKVIENIRAYLSKHSG